MKPTLMPGDRIMTRNMISLNDKPLRGDIVVFIPPDNVSKTYVKRVVGIEGDEIQIKNDKLFVNDTRVKTVFIEEYSIENKGHVEIYEETIDEKMYLIFDQYNFFKDFGPVTVPENSVFVLGDNRDNSMDSRHFGFISLDMVLSKPLYIFWAKDKSRLGLRLD